MITKRVWTKERFHKGAFSSDDCFTHQLYEGWYLLSVIPLYVRAAGPEKNKYSFEVYGIR